MDHNPRRDKSPHVPAPPILANAQMTDAMARNVEIRGHRGIDRATVEATPRTAGDAIEENERRSQSWDDRMRCIKGDPPNPRWHIGWVSIQPDWLRNTWAVWLNVEDERIHLRLECHRRSKDDPYP